MAVQKKAKELCKKKKNSAKKSEGGNNRKVLRKKKSHRTVQGKIIERCLGKKKKGTTPCRNVFMAGRSGQ